MSVLEHFPSIFPTTSILKSTPTPTPTLTLNPDPRTQPIPPAQHQHTPDPCHHLPPTGSKIGRPSIIEMHGTVESQLLGVLRDIAASCGKLREGVAAMSTEIKSLKHTVETSENKLQGLDKEIASLVKVVKQVAQTIARDDHAARSRLGSLCGASLSRPLSHELRDRPLPTSTGGGLSSNAPMSTGAGASISTRRGGNRDSPDSTCATNGTAPSNTDSGEVLNRPSEGCGRDNRHETAPSIRGFANTASGGGPSGNNSSSVAVDRWVSNLDSGASTFGSIFGNDRSPVPTDRGVSNTFTTQGLFGRPTAPPGLFEQRDRQHTTPRRVVTTDLIFEGFGPLFEGLRPLRNVRTGAEIPNSPNTLAGITALDGTDTPVHFTSLLCTDQLTDTEATRILNELQDTRTFNTLDDKTLAIGLFWLQQNFRSSTV